ncbi:MAG: hypothetical protein QM533_08075 [Cytophagales bacterium]|nr:hypothetical protein [Cytophagales bacterium]
MPQKFAPTFHRLVILFLGVTIHGFSISQTNELIGCWKQTAGRMTYENGNVTDTPFNPNCYSNYTLDRTWSECPKDASHHGNVSSYAVENNSIYTATIISSKNALFMVGTKRTVEFKIDKKNNLTLIHKFNLSGPPPTQGSRSTQFVATLERIDCPSN